MPILMRTYGSKGFASLGTIVRTSMMGISFFPYQIFILAGRHPRVLDVT